LAGRMRRRGAGQREAAEDHEGCASTHGSTPCRGTPRFSPIAPRRAHDRHRAATGDCARYWRGSMRPENAMEPRAKSMELLIHLRRTDCVTPAAAVGLALARRLDAWA